MSFAPVNSGLKGYGCGLSQRNIESGQAANYVLAGFQCGPGMAPATLVATEQPMVNFSGSRQMAIGGKNVSTNSELLVNDLSKGPEKLSLQQPMFVTSPFLGRGHIDTETETDMRNMPYRQNRKSLNPSSEKCYNAYSQTPMLPALKLSIQNPANLVEPVAAAGWERGGMSSRQYSKQYGN